MSKVAEILHKAPVSPGVYLMKDVRGAIFYVGKAKNLHARMHQYINPKSDTRLFVQILDRLLATAEFILTGNETEALLLETTLIKKHRPRYNVRIKDDTNYFSLRLDLGQPYPRLEFIRQRRRKDKALLFGPYPSAGAARQVLALVNRHFQLRDCDDEQFKRAKRPCLRHQMGRCQAPCSLPVDPQAYLAELERLRLFLEGRTADLLRELSTAMRAFSQELEFERAAHLRDLITAIKSTTERQVTNLPREVDWDVLGFFRQAEDAAVAVIKLREGRIVGRDAKLLSCRAEPDEAALAAFLMDYYELAWPLPKMLLVPFAPSAVESVGAWLSERRGSPLLISVPERGDGARLLAMAQSNAQSYFQQRAEKSAESAAALERLAHALDLPSPPRRIECFDISNIQGQLAVGSMVCLLDGQPAKSEYRRFRITLGQTPDDFAMMREVLLRRLRRGQQSGELPDLLLVDGGKGQLGVAEACLADLGLEHIALAGLAKSRLKDEVGEGEVAQAFEGKLRTPERVFVPGRKNPILLKPGTRELSLLLLLRDEAHRFAITYHRLLRSRRALKSGLIDIPGVGEKRAKLLLKTFGSLKRLKAVRAEDIAALPGFPLSLAQSIVAYLAQEEAPPAPDPAAPAAD